jgi:hypothetical protein
MRNRRTIEIGVIILFIGFTTLMHFIVWANFDFFKESKTMNQIEFHNTLFTSFIRAIIIDSGLIFIYYINKNRIKKGKKPI